MSQYSRALDNLMPTWGEGPGTNALGPVRARVGPEIQEIIEPESNDR